MVTPEELDSLTKCECGHWANAHASDGCHAIDDDGCVCMFSPALIAERAVERIIAARVAAERARLLDRIETVRRAQLCRTCNAPTPSRSRETVGMICQRCGWNYMNGEPSLTAVVAEERAR
jgi:hypothetical protein